MLETRLVEKDKEKLDSKGIEGSSKLGQDAMQIILEILRRNGQHCQHVMLIQRKTNINVI